MTTRQLVEDYRDINADLVTLAQRDLEAWWARQNHSDVAATRNALTVYMNALVTTYGRPAALLAAQFYDDMRAASLNATGRYRATLADGPKPEQIEQTARWAVGALVDEDPDSALARAAGALQRYVVESGRNTISYNSWRDPSRCGYARVPGFSRSGTCGFCNMLASRGAVYRSEQSAKFAKDGDKYHDNCTCVPTPVWDGDPYPDGYDPDALYDEYRQAVDSLPPGSYSKSNVIAALDAGRVR